MNSPNRRAFTLVELLVVVSIITALVSMLIPSVEAAMKQARVAVCATNQHAIGTALNTYTNDHQQRTPWVGYGGNNYFTYYVLYRTIQEGGGTVPPYGFQNLGLLGTGGGRYLSLQSRAWFCPLQTCDTGAMFSGGDRNFWSAAPNNLDGSTLAPEDAGLGWISRRTGYLRRRLASQTDMESIKFTEYGSGAVLADLFSYPPTHVRKSHDDSVNVLFVDGGVVKRNFPLDTLLPFSFWKDGAPGYTPGSQLLKIWERLERSDY